MSYSMSRQSIYSCCKVAPSGVLVISILSLECSEAYLIHEFWAHRWIFSIDWSLLNLATRSFFSFVIASSTALQ